MSKNKNVAMSKFILCSLFGIFMFFVPISIEGKSSIPLDHIVSWILQIPYYRETYGLILCFLGVILPFWKGTWNKSKVKMIFSIINIAALPLFSWQSFI